MMDLKEIIKWFIPCFHILQSIFKSREFRWTFICLFLLFNFRVGCAANVSGVENTKKVFNVDSSVNVNQSDVLADMQLGKLTPELSDGSVGRTFGRPFKKMMTALLPLVFQIGAASTWAVVAALVGVKTLFVTLVILKILLVAGAAKVLEVAHNAVQYDILRRQALMFHQLYRLQRYAVNKNTTNNTKAEASKLESKEQLGALFGAKGHHGSWEPPHHPQKEIHLHIHNGGHHEPHDEHVPVYGGWSREDVSHAVETKSNLVDAYPVSGPQTIRTPFGNYIKVESNDPSVSAK